MTITLEALKADAPDLYAKIQAEAAQNAISGEQARLKAIDELALAGYDDLVTAAKADVTQTADTLAKAIVLRQKTNATNTLNSLASNAPAPIVAPSTAQCAVGQAQRPTAFASLKERADWEFANDPTIESQGFADADTYFYALKAEGAKP